jgi:hypothetical protein
MRLRFLLLAFALVFAPSMGSAQLTNVNGMNEVFAGGELERYLRYLQMLGSIPLYPWGNRAFSPAELEVISKTTEQHPWQPRLNVSDRNYRRLQLSIIAPNVVGRYNTSFPFGSNDGPVWAGKGLTTAIQFGGSARWGPLSVSLAPLAFLAQNSDFELRDNGQFQLVTGGPYFQQPYGDAVFPRDVDRPQRFGDKPYARLDPGNSFVRLDTRFVTLGASSANEYWGPATDYPIILGNNAPGFPHLFLGTGRPLNLLIGHAHFRAIWGKLSQSAYSSVTGSDYYVDRAHPGRVRFMSGAVGIFQPRGITGLEVGLARFFHSVLDSSGPTRRQMLRPFEGFLKAGVKKDPQFSDEIGDNQIASVFFRWVLPRGAAEFYAEYGKEDHNYDFRDVVQELDHGRAYMMGFRKAFSVTDSAFSAIRAEMIDFRLPHIARHRNEGSNYMHHLLRQGHTERGQLLGADVGVGRAAGSTVAYDRYHERGRITIAWLRDVRAELGNFWYGDVESQTTTDVSHAIQLETLRFMTRFDLLTSLTLVRELNRHFRRDATNVNFTIGARLNVERMNIGAQRPNTPR